MQKTLNRLLFSSPEGITFSFFLFRIKEFEGAVDFFTRAVNINSCFLDAYIGRGNSYMEYEQDKALKLAQKDFLKALHIDPSSLKARISLGYNLQVKCNSIFSTENIVQTEKKKNLAFYL